MDRRRVIFLGGAAAFGATAGCLGDGDSGNEGENGGQDDGRNSDQNGGENNDQNNGGNNNQNGGEDSVQEDTLETAARQLFELANDGDISGVRDMTHPESPESPISREDVEGAREAELQTISTELSESDDDSAVVEYTVTRPDGKVTSEVEFRARDGEWLMYAFLSEAGDSVVQN